MAGTRRRSTEPAQTCCVGRFACRRAGVRVNAVESVQAVCETSAHSQQRARWEQNEAARLSSSEVSRPRPTAGDFALIFTRSLLFAERDDNDDALMAVSLQGI